MWFLVFVIIPEIRIGVLSKTDDMWSKEMEKKIVDILNDMKRFSVHSTQQIEEYKDSSVNFIMNKFDLDYLLVGKMERIESDIKPYADIKDTVYGGYKTVAIAVMDYELRIYQRDKKTPKIKRFTGSGESSLFASREDAEEEAFRDVVYSLEDYLKKFFALRGKVMRKFGRRVVVNLGEKNGIEEGMVFIAKGKKGYGFFVIDEVDVDSSSGRIIKGASKIRKGYRIKECPYGVGFVYLDAGWMGVPLVIEDVEESAYGGFVSVKAGRRYRCDVGFLLSFSPKIFPLIDVGFSPSFFIGENLSFGPLVRGKIFFVSQHWESTDGGKVLEETEGSATGTGVGAGAGIALQFEIEKIQLSLSFEKQISTTISQWMFSNEVDDETKTEKVPEDYLEIKRFKLGDYMCRFGIGINFEIY